MASSSDFKVKKGLQIHGGDINFSNAQHADIRIDAAAAGTDSAGKNLTISSGGTTGNESTSITLKTTTAGSSGTDTNSPTSKIVIGGAGVTTFTAGGDLDIGSHDFKAQTLTSDVTTGTAPLTVSSTTEVANLNAAKLSGADWDAPLAIGGTTAAPGTFTTLTATGTSTLTTVDINGGAIDGTTIGATSASTGAFSTLTTSSTATIGTDLTVSGGDIIYPATASTLGMTAASGTDTAAGSLTISAATATGDEDGGELVFKTGGAGGTSGTSTATTAVTALTLAAAGGASFLNTVTVGTDLTVTGGDINFANGQNASLQIADTAVGTTGKNMTIAAGSPAPGTTSDIAGGGLMLQGGRGKGTGAGGSVTIQSAPATTTGSSNNNFAGGIEVKGNHTGDIVLTTATGGDENDEIVQVRNRTLQIRPKRGNSWNGSAGEVVALYIGDDGNSSSTGDMDSDRMVFYDLDEYSWRAGLNVKADTGNMSNPIYEIGVGRTVTGNTGTAAPTQAEYATAKTGFAMDHNGHILRIGSTNPSSGDFLSWDNSNARWVPAGLTSAAISTSSNTNSADNSIVTYSSTGGTSVDSSANLTFDGSKLAQNYDTSDTTAVSQTMYHLDVDKTGVTANSATTALVGMDMDMTDSATNHTGSTVSMTGMDMDIIMANAAGTTTVTGLNVAVQGADSNYAAVFTHGSVGIGTATPTVPLDVVGASKFEGDVTIQGTENTAGNLYLKADQGDDAADEWKISVADGGVLSIGNDIASAGTFVSQLTLTPNATQASSTTTVEGSLVVDGDLTVSGTNTVISSTVINVDDKNLELGAVDSPTDTTANGGGITLKGDTDKTILWDSTNSNWTSNQDWNIATGKVFRINNTSVLSASTLGSGVTTSSLTTVGALNSGSITSGFTSIDVGAGAISTTGTVTTGALTVGGDIGTAAAQDWDLVDNNASALSFDAQDKSGILEIDTTNDAEGVNMSGHLLMGGVALMDAATGTITDGANTTLYSWAAADYSAAKFIVSVWKDDSDDYRNVTEILCTYDGATAPSGDDDINMVEYAMVEDATGGNLGTFEVDQDGGSPVNIRLRFDPGAGTFKWRLHATLLAT